MGGANYGWGFRPAIRQAGGGGGGLIMVGGLDPRYDKRGVGGGGANYGWGVSPAIRQWGWGEVYTSGTIRKAGGGGVA